MGLGPRLETQGVDRSSRGKDGHFQCLNSEGTNLISQRSRHLTIENKLNGKSGATSMSFGTLIPGEKYHPLQGKRGGLITNFQPSKS